MPGAAEPTYFATEADFRRWLEANHKTAPELLVGFWKKGNGRPSIDWPQARDQALCFGWIDGIRRSLGDEAYTIRFTPRRKGSIWSKVNVERFEALKAAGQMTPAGQRVFDEKIKSGVYAYEKALAELTPDETAQFGANAIAWADWERRPPGYRKVVLHWVTSAKKPETRAKRLATLIEDSEAGRKIAGYDIGRKKDR
ncbi:MAG TPA: YdeI/OmpD-associated family protein [Allosphingosinicella sp.]